MKICVYAICKNEIKNVDSWYESMKEADDIFVLDTGSTDGTYERLLELGINTRKEIITPWRFDIARNKSLEYASKEADLYVCTDLDECFNKGWCSILKNKYDKKYTRISYTYNWSFDKYGKPSTTFMLNKIHTKDYCWVNPVHEVLKPVKEELEQTIKEIVLNHYQDQNKSRTSYLKLLELSVKEDPENDRNIHYLGREYMYYKKYDKAIKTLHDHLINKNATWKDERCASMRYIARCYNSKKYYEEAMLWYNLAINEAPYLREAYVELAFLLINKNNYKDAYKLLNKAFKIKNKSNTYINESFAWNYEIYNLYAICAFYLNKKDIAYKYELKAISLNPDDQSLKNNLIFFDKNSMNNKS